MSDDRHKDVVNKAHVKTRLANFVFKNGHPLNVLHKGMYEAGGAGCRGLYEGGGTGHHNQDQDTRHQQHQRQGHLGGEEDAGARRRR